MDILLGIMNQLLKIEIKDAIHNGQRMSSAIVIMCCLQEMIPKCIPIFDIPSESIASLLSLLSLMPDMHHRKCADWDYMITLIPDSYRKTAYESVLALTVHLSHTTYFAFPDWLYAIPVVHFLKNTSQPFKAIELNSEQIPWGDKLIGLESIRSHNNNTKNMR